ncbi:hypothetical protein Tco_0603846 [Tanacetum coccineum]
MSSYNHPGCSCCGGPFNGGNCPSCSSVGSGNEFVYDPNPYSYNETPNFFNQPPQHQYETYSCELCGNDAHYGYDCPPQVPFISNPDPCYNQDLDNFLQTSLKFQQQYLCCENCGGPHETFQCQPLNQNFYEPNLCYNSIASGFDQFQPSQFPVIHQPPQEMSIQDMEDLKQEYLDKMKSLINEFPIKDYRDEKIDIKINELKENFNGMSIEINKKKKLQQLEQVANLSTYPSRLFNSFCYDDDDDDDEEYTIAITPVLPIEEPDNSLSMGDEYLSTIPETESDELIKSSVENLVPIPSESEDFSDIEKFNSENSNAIIESFSLSPILVEDTDDSMPSGIENDDYDSEGDILFLEELHSNGSPSLHENESFHFDVPSSPRPSAKPLDDGIYFEPDTGVFTKVVDDISNNLTRELYVHVPNILPTLPTLSLMFDTLLPFSSENEDKVHLLYHRGFKAFQVIFDFSESPMMIYGEDIPILDVPFLHLYTP